MLLRKSNSLFLIEMQIIFPNRVYYQLTYNLLKYLAIYLFIVYRSILHLINESDFALMSMRGFARKNVLFLFGGVTDAGNSDGSLTFLQIALSY